MSDTPNDIPSVSRIDKQKRLAKTILSELHPHGFNAILAGGAVRDWSYNRVATDLDIFISGDPRPDALEQIFGIKPELLGENKYDKSIFEGFEFEMEGQKVQFLFHDCEDPRDLVPEFPISLSQCYWDGEKYWHSRAFKISKEYRVTIAHGDLEVINHLYLDKVEGKFPNHRHYISFKSFLKHHFRERRFVPDWLNVGAMAEGEPVGFVRQPEL